jgi:hypothetical protein
MKFDEMFAANEIPPMVVKDCPHCHREGYTLHNVTEGITRVGSYWVENFSRLLQHMGYMAHTIAKSTGEEGVVWVEIAKILDPKTGRWIKETQ